jgi:polyisoprenoid-binding protein YceI
LVGALVLAAIAAGGAIYLFGRSTPAAVSLGDPTPSPGASATMPASDPPTGGPTTTASSTPGAVTGEALDGTWVVDTSLGSFDDFSGSFVGYRVQEELANVGAATAVGRTPDVGGSLVLEGSTLTSVEIEADLTGLQSDSSQRDGQLDQQGIETARFPTASFQLAEPLELGAAPADGQTLSVVATGEFTLHGVTRTVEIPLQARIDGDVVTVVGSLEIVFADYDIAKPQSFRVLSIADVGVMEFQLLFLRG